jgi:hypothetical protein
MYYSFSNCSISINGTPLAANSVDINTAAQVKPVFTIGTKDAERYVSNGFVQKLSLSYFLTGKDVLKTFITTETANLSGNFAGYYFETGYLQSYVASMVPNNPIEVKADIFFIDKLKGTFTPTQNRWRSETPILNLSDIIISSDATLESITNVSSFNYSYSNDITPIFEIEYETGVSQIFPTKVAFGSQKLSLEVVTDDVLMDLSYLGKTGVGCRIDLAHPLNPGLSETFICSGILTEKNLGTSSENNLRKTLKIETTDLTTPFSITSFTPASLLPGVSFTINGSNLTDIYQITFGDSNAVLDTFTVKTDGVIKGIVPLQALPGYATIYAPHQEVKYYFPVTYYPPIASALSSLTGNPTLSTGNAITIFGDNFTHIDTVYFGDIPSPQFHVNKEFNSILAFVPTGVKNDFIKIVSSKKVLTGTSVAKFITSPVINTINPESGTQGTTVRITGRNFANVGSNVYFNFGSGQIAASSVTVNSETSIDAVVPAGLTRGKISVINSYNLHGESSNIFNPFVRITGVNFTGASTGQFILISGDNFDTAIMYPTGSNTSGSTQYLVYFNNESAPFTVLSPILMSGYPVTGDVNGEISIAREDNASTYKTPFSFKLFGAAAPTYLINSSNLISSRTEKTIAYSGKIINTRAEGTYLDFVTGLRFSGFSGVNSGKSFSFGRPYISGVSGGAYLFATGFRTRGQETGYYHVDFLSPYGNGRLSGVFNLLAPYNVAPYGSGKQSSNFHTSLYQARLAIDRNFTGNQANYGISLTAAEQFPYWEVDLGSTKPDIDRIVISNRRDSSASGLNNFWVFIEDGNRVQTFKSGFYTGNSNFPNFVEEIVIPTPVSGRYVRIAESGLNVFPLGLSQVEVY